MSRLPPPNEQPGQEPAFSIENVEFVDERPSTRSLSASQHQHHGVYSGSSVDNSNNGGVVDERHRNYVQESGYAAVPTQGYGATAYYAQQQHAQQQQQQQHAQQQQQAYYGSGGHQQQHPLPPSPYYGMPPYQGYGAPQHSQMPPQGSHYGQEWQGVPQVYDYGAPPVYGYATQQQQQQAYTSSQQQQLQAQQQQEQQHRRASSGSSPVATHTRKSSEPIHPLKRGKESTFTASPWSDQAEHVSLLRDNATGYGAVSKAKDSSKRASNNRQSPGDVFTQPTFKSEPGARGLDAIEQSMVSALDRAGISGGSYRKSPSARQPKSHRRASSDTPLQGARRDKIPPMAGRLMRRNVTPVATSNAGATLNRQRSFSASQSDAAQRQRDMTGSQLAPLGGVSRPLHRRTTSMNSVANSMTSAATDASHYSIVSDIRKSSFYGGVHEASGAVQMHYPFENVYLAVVDDAEKLAMNKGHLYVANADEQMYENYHRVAEEIDLDVHWQMDNPLACNCTCNNCNACTGKQELLPPNYYAMAVDEDLYRRVLIEIAKSRTMPCGLFFCGHHEDVSRPSICIAVSIVFVLFTGMGAIAYTIRA